MTNDRWHDGWHPDVHRDACVAKYVYHEKTCSREREHGTTRAELFIRYSLFDLWSMIGSSSGSRRMT